MVTFRGADMHLGVSCFRPLLHSVGLALMKFSRRLDSLVVPTVH